MEKNTETKAIETKIVSFGQATELTLGNGQIFYETSSRHKGNY